MSCFDSWVGFLDVEWLPWKNQALGYAKKRSSEALLLSCLSSTSSLAIEISWKKPNLCHIAALAMFILAMFSMQHVTTLSYHDTSVLKIYLKGRHGMTRRYYGRIPSYHCEAQVEIPGRERWGGGQCDGGCD